MKICYECRQPINGFNYGVGFRHQCGRCYDKEQEYYRRKEIQELEIEKMKLEIERLKRDGK